MNINQKLAEQIKNEGIIKFVDTVNTSLDTSVLQVEKEAAFVQAIQAASPMLDRSRYIRMASDKKDIDRIDMELDLEDGSRNSTTGVISLTDQDPDFTTNELDVEKLMAKTQLTYEAVEDNIEQGSLESTIISLFGRAAGRSLERIFIFGDTDLVAGANVPSGYPVIDGWIAKADSDQVLDSGDFDDTDIETVMETMYDAMDPQYVDESVFYVAKSRESEYRRALKGKDTALGDTAVTGNNQLYFEGVPVIVVPALSYPIVNSNFNTNISKEVLFLGRPQNFVHGLKREIMVETDKNITNQMYDFVLSLRGDCHYEDETKVVVGRPSTT